MLQTHTFKIIWSQTKHAPDTAPTTTQQSKPRAANPRVLQRTERLLEEGPAAVGVALKIGQPKPGESYEMGPAAGCQPTAGRQLTLGADGSWPTAQQKMDDGGQLQANFGPTLGRL